MRRKGAAPLVYARPVCPGCNGTRTAHFHDSTWFCHDCGLTWEARPFVDGDAYVSRAQVADRMYELDSGQARATAGQNQLPGPAEPAGPALDAVGGRVDRKGDV